MSVLALRNVANSVYCTVGTITTVCIFDAIQLKDGQAEINGNACRTCGRCAEVCSNDAIEAIINDNDFINTAIRNISEGLDITK